MRVLPYFQSSLIKRPAQAAVRKAADAAPGLKSAGAASSFKAAAGGKFIPLDNTGRLAGAGEKTPAGLEKAAGAQAETAGPDMIQTVPGLDEFVPSIPVTGVVHSIRSDPRAEAKPSGVLKSGNYSIYKLNGYADKAQTTAKGDKLDLKG